ncbi:hypothetical protein PC118_g18044 [Phytophthora cactorum]|uniref:Major facilitator superfamily associated domain-containing protein n=2 Tax=Phytophthora cactorum TaxID=29920 RepID=A0A8T1FB99_9STRA|nr:hypothetical protein PC118_g18044 [Phytophthora cactorum]
MCQYILLSPRRCSSDCRRLCPVARTVAGLRKSETSAADSGGRVFRRAFSGQPGGCGVAVTRCVPQGRGFGWMQRVAIENNLSETAYVALRERTAQTPNDVVEYDLRWFTPGMEVKLCGHATLSTAFAFQIQSGPASSLLDHAVLDLLAKGGEYGRQRLFGAVGWGIGTYLTGIAVACRGIFWSFNLCLIVGFSTLLVLQRIPPVKYDEYTALETADEGEQGVSDVTPSFLETTRLISKKMDVLLNLYNLAGDDPHIIGVAIMCEISSELPAFFFADKIVKKIGTVNVLLVSLVGYTLRISYYALMTNAWGAIPFEFLHGITFGLTWAACTQYVFSAAPRGCEGTVMGVLSAVQNGLARASGTLIGGYFYENYGARAMWTFSMLSRMNQWLDGIHESTPSLHGLSNQNDSVLELRARMGLSTIFSTEIRSSLISSRDVDSSEEDNALLLV